MILFRPYIIFIGFSFMLWPLMAIADAATDQENTTNYERLWDLATLYKNNENPIIEEFKLRGRYQGQYYWLNSDQGNRGTLGKTADLDLALKRCCLEEQSKFK